MSLIFNKGKNKYTNLEQLKIKNNKLNLYNTNPIQKKQKKNINNNSQAINDYESLSPFININTNKKINFLFTYQNILI